MLTRHDSIGNAGRKSGRHFYLLVPNCSLRRTPPVVRGNTANACGLKKSKNFARPMSATDGQTPSCDHSRQTLHSTITNPLLALDYRSQQLTPMKVTQMMSTTFMSFHRYALLPHYVARLCGLQVFSNNSHTQPRIPPLIRLFSTVC